MTPLDGGVPECSVRSSSRPESSTSLKTSAVRACAAARARVGRTDLVTISLRSRNGLVTVSLRREQAARAGAAALAARGRVGRGFDHRVPSRGPMRVDGVTVDEVTVHGSRASHEKSAWRRPLQDRYKTVTKPLPEERVALTFGQTTRDIRCSERNARNARNKRNVRNGHKVCVTWRSPSAARAN